LQLAAPVEGDPHAAQIGEKGAGSIDQKGARSGRGVAFTAIAGFSPAQKARRGAPSPLTSPISL
jgi:hypothetical protein